MKYLKLLMIFTLLCLLAVGGTYFIKYGIFSPKSAKNINSEITEGKLFSAEAYFNHGAEDYQKSQYEHAILDFSKAIEINPVYAEAYANRGVAYGNKGIYDKAISDFNKAIELNPEYPDVYFNKAQLCEK